MEDIIKHRNGKLVEFSDVMSACLKCNQSFQLLGSSIQAKVAMYYLVKYLTKDCTALEAILPSVIEARQTQLKYPSIADDTGTNKRTAQHLITRILNNLTGNVEIGGQMAAMISYGETSTNGSHTGWFCHAYPAIADVLYNRDECSKELNFDSVKAKNDDENDTDTDVDVSDEDTDTFNKIEKIIKKKKNWYRR